MQCFGRDRRCAGEPSDQWPQPCPTAETQPVARGALEVRVDRGDLTDSGEQRPQKGLLFVPATVGCPTRRPDAWVDHEKIKVGYEIPFNRHFYDFEPPRELAEIDADLKQVTDRIKAMIDGLQA